jgi:hypothetical protein
MQNPSSIYRRYETLEKEAQLGSCSFDMSLRSAFLRSRNPLGLARESWSMHERRTITSAGAPFLSQMLFTFEDDEFVHLGLVSFLSWLTVVIAHSCTSQEFCPGGDLLTHLARTGSFQPLLSRFYASEMVCSEISLSFGAYAVL